MSQQRKVEINFVGNWPRLQRDLKALAESYREPVGQAMGEPILSDARLADVCELLIALVSGDPDWPALRDVADKARKDMESIRVGRESGYWQED